MNTLEAAKALDRIFSNWNIRSNDKKCVFIDGAWGIGKTHFIQNYFSKNNNEFIYTSVFGKNSVRHIEKSILIHSLPVLKKINENSGVTKVAQRIANDLSSKFLGVSIDSYLNSFSIDDIVNLDKISNKRKIICFDDFERKSNSIEMKSMMGLIEQASKNFNVLIIGNIHKLNESDIDIFNEYKEKVIDYVIEIDKIDRTTLVSILNSMNIENRNEIIDAYLNDNVAFGKAPYGEKTFSVSKINNLRIFLKYIELILRLEKYLEPYKADKDVLKICKTVTYDYYFPDKDNKKYPMNFDKFNIYKTVNKVLINEDVKKDEFQEYFIANSEVREDIRSVYFAYRLNEREFENLIKKIKIKIQDKDLKYFIKQENVISLASVLNEFKIIDKDIFKKLFEIAIDLYSPEAYILHRKIDYSQWNDINYFGNEIECDKIIKLFVEKINEKSSEKFQSFIIDKLEKAKNTKNYEELLKLHNFYKINRIEDFEDIFDYYFNQLAESYSDEIAQKINNLISKTNSELISSFFTNRIKSETQITKIKKYEQFDSELDIKMQYEAEQEYYMKNPPEETE